MAYVSNLEELDEWRNYCAMRFAHKPHVNMVLQVWAALVDRETWEVSVVRNQLADDLGVTASAFYKNWDLALKTRLAEKSGFFEYKTAKRTLSAPKLRLVLPPNA